MRPSHRAIGVTDKDAEPLAQGFGIQTIRDLANNEPLNWARPIVIAVDLEE